MKARNVVRNLGIHAALVTTSIVAVYPALWVLKMALSPIQGFDSSPSLLPTHVTLDNFRAFVMTTTASREWLFGHQLFNSLVVSGTTTLIGVALACTSGYAFSRFRFPGRDAGLLALLITQIFPGVVMMIPLYILLDYAHLLNSLLGLAIVYSSSSVPFCTWMLKGYFDTLPKELEEAARIDGASSFRIFWTIALPLARPAIVVTALFSFMTAWNEFILAATLMNDEIHFTLPVALQRHVGEYSTDWGLFAAGAILVSVPVMVLFYALQRHLIGGLTAGAVKT